jgi:hypothetical protein
MALQVGIGSSTQHTDGGDTVEMLKNLFPEECGSLSCPRDQHNTLVVPHLFTDLQEEWQYCQDSEDVRRSRPFSLCFVCSLPLTDFLTDSLQLQLLRLTD